MFYNNLSFEISDTKMNEIAALTFLPITNQRGNLTGKQFHHLTVLGKGPDYISPGGHRQSRWWCICDCEEHKILLVRGCNLTSNNTKSCGCQNTAARKENVKKATEASKVDLTNQKFGELIAIKPTDKRNNGSVVWECKCSCGNIHYVAANELTAHRIESCGCVKKSKGIRKIQMILNNANIPYESEYIFNDCRFPDSNALARFDFFINNQFLLEYDGIQHFKECDTHFFHDSFQKRQAHDLFKNNWCKEHNILLKRIPYTDIDQISLDTIMGDKYLL